MYYITESIKINNSINNLLQLDYHLLCYLNQRVKSVLLHMTETIKEQLNIHTIRLSTDCLASLTDIAEKEKQVHCCK